MKRSITTDQVYADYLLESHNTGRVTANQKSWVRMLSGSCSPTAVIADGSTTGIGTHVGQFLETDTITGGTGRFTGAQGSFIVERLKNQTGFTSGSFHGTITSPGAAH